MNKYFKIFGIGNISELLPGTFLNVKSPVTWLSLLFTHTCTEILRRKCLNELHLRIVY